MPPTVLLVDDEPNVLDSIRRGLRHEGLDILTAESGARALKYLAAQEIAVLVTDQDMPSMRGLDLLNHAREEWPETVRFMLTGKATLDLALAAINTGQITRFFQKPCNVEELAGAIHQGVIQYTLLRKVRELMEIARSQQEQLALLEQVYPGISKIERDADGQVLLNPQDVDYQLFLRELPR